MDKFEGSAAIDINSSIYDAKKAIDACAVNNNQAGNPNYEKELKDAKLAAEKKRIEKQTENSTRLWETIRRVLQVALWFGLSVFIALVLLWLFHNFNNPYKVEQALISAFTHSITASIGVVVSGYFFMRRK
jgi:hypothetical protein